MKFTSCKRHSQLLSMKAAYVGHWICSRKLFKLNVTVSDIKIEVIFTWKLVNDYPMSCVGCNCRYKSGLFFPPLACCLPHKWHSCWSSLSLCSYIWLMQAQPLLSRDCTLHLRISLFCGPSKGGSEPQGEASLIYLPICDLGRVDLFPPYSRNFESLLLICLLTFEVKHITLS